MRTLIPEAVTATAHPLRRKRLFGGGLVRKALILLGVGAALAGMAYWSHSWSLSVSTFWTFAAELWTAVVLLLLALDCAGATRRTLWLLATGLVWLVPAFYHPQRLWMMLAWDTLVVVLVGIDLAMLPAAKRVQVTRRFLDSPKLGERTVVELEVVQDSGAVLTVVVTDGLDVSLLPMPVPKTVVAFPRDPVRCTMEVYPGRRGDIRLGAIYLQYRSALGLAERWAEAAAEQEIRVFPGMDESGSDSAVFLMRARQIEIQKRRLRLRGVGREFESLRDYQRGDELRNISWTATARRARLITRLYTTERSQQVWILLDAGRLSRTAYELRRRGVAHEAESEQEAAENLQLIVTQLDQAATATVMLAEAVQGSGDKFGLLTYGRAVQQQLLQGAGPSHLRVLIDQLARVKGEPAEANHLMASTRLKQLQRRRALVVWITEIADSAGLPEVVSAAIDLVRRHLVLVVLLRHPELDELARSEATDVAQMYRAAAASEMLDRRNETIARLRQMGVLVVEASPGDVGLKTINSYLDIKAKGLI
jgi:uncharacterized protein (DUF58 family)